MAISPIRMALFRGVKAMNAGTKNPFGKPQLMATPVSKPRLGGKPALGASEDKPRYANRPQSAPKQYPNNDLKTPKKIIQQGGSQSTNTKSTAAQAAAVGTKKYGMTGRSAPNIGPTSTSGSMGYKKRTMVQAARAAADNLKMKKARGL